MILPNEIILDIFKLLTNIRDVSSWSTTCKTCNSVYRRWLKEIVNKYIDVQTYISSSRNVNFDVVEYSVVEHIGIKKYGVYISIKVDKYLETIHATICYHYKNIKVDKCPYKERTDIKDDPCTDIIDINNNLFNGYQIVEGDNTYMVYVNNNVIDYILAVDSQYVRLYKQGSRCLRTFNIVSMYDMGPIMPRIISDKKYAGYNLNTILAFKDDESFRMPIYKNGYRLTQLISAIL